LILLITLSHISCKLYINYFGHRTVIIRLCLHVLLLAGHHIVNVNYTTEYTHSSVLAHREWSHYTYTQENLYQNTHMMMSVHNSAQWDIQSQNKQIQKLIKKLYVASDCCSGSELLHVPNQNSHILYCVMSLVCLLKWRFWST